MAMEISSRAKTRLATVGACLLMFLLGYRMESLLEAFYYIDAFLFGMVLFMLWEDKNDKNN